MDMDCPYRDFMLAISTAIYFWYQWRGMALTVIISVTWNIDITHSLSLIITACIYLKAVPIEAQEVLPIFSSSSKHLLTRGALIGDWTGRTHHHGPRTWLLKIIKIAINISQKTDLTKFTGHLIAIIVKNNLIVNRYSLSLCNSFLYNKCKK